MGGHEGVWIRAVVMVKIQKRLTANRRRGHTWRARSNGFRGMGKLAIVYVFAYFKVDLKNARRLAICVGAGRSIGVTVTLMIWRVRRRVVVGIRVGHGYISVADNEKVWEERFIYWQGYSSARTLEKCDARTEIDTTWLRFNRACVLDKHIPNKILNNPGALMVIGLPYLNNGHRQATHYNTYT